MTSMTDPFLTGGHTPVSAASARSGLAPVPVASTRPPEQLSSDTRVDPFLVRAAEQRIAEDRVLCNVDIDPFMMHDDPEMELVRLEDGSMQHDIANDPFLTHAELGQRLDHGEVDRLADVNPMSSRAARGGEGKLDDVWKDPFLIRGGLSPQEAAREFHWRHFLGTPDPHRDLQTLRILVCLPYLVYVLILTAVLFLRHYNLELTCLLISMLAAAACLSIVASFNGKAIARAPLGLLGILCLVAVALGVVTGDLGWRRVFRQFWWSRTGFNYQDETIQTPSDARSDAYSMNFNRKDKQAKVDTERSAGYRSSHTFCAAPVLDRQMVVGQYNRVNYWAIGIDCCSPIGSFWCDDSRDSAATIGIVALDGGIGCAGCYRDEFRQAINKAEANYGLVSGGSKIIAVQWVKSLDSFNSRLSWKAVLYYLFTLLITVPVFFVAAYIPWYSGRWKMSLDDEWERLWGGNTNERKIMPIP